MPSWMEWVWTSVVDALPGFAILLPALYLVGRIIIERMISREFENEREALKYQIATLLARSTKLHDREFETLEAVWEKASRSMVSAASVLSLLQTHPDISRMDGERLDQLLAQYEFQTWEVAEIKAEPHSNRSRKFYEFAMEKKRHRAWKDAADFNDYLIIKGIFLKSDVEEKARALANLIWELLDEDRWTGEEGSEAFKNRRALADRIRKEGAQLRDEVRALIASRLWDVDLKKAA